MSSFSAYNASRTPVLDGQHENAAHGELPLNANEAHRLANLMIDGRAPLRTPILDVQLSLASSEFANPVYVDAVIRTMALQDRLRCYDPEDLGTIVGTGTEVPATIAGIAGKALTYAAFPCLNRRFSLLIV